MAALGSSWNDGGKIEFLTLAKNIISNGDHEAGNKGRRDLKRILYEVCDNVLKGSLKADQVVPALAELAEIEADVPSLLADVFCILDLETSSLEEQSQRDQLLNFIPECSPFVPDPVLKERLEPETAENIGLIESKETFQKTYVKVKTRLYYKQQKFNLLREENEGYSKLVGELNQDFSLSGLTYKIVHDNIKALIGCFNLDPNRVLDIILESFECRSELDQFFIPLIQTYINDRDAVCHILGFKFQFYLQTQDSETPSSIYKVAALLLHHGLIDLTTLYAHLGPSDHEIGERHKKELTDAKAYARKTTVVMLGGDKDKDKDKDDKDVKLDMSANNQKFGLIEALIRIGDWSHAKRIMDRLPAFSAVSYPPVAQAICKLLHHSIDQLYQKHSGLSKLLTKRRVCHNDMKGVMQVQTYQEFASEVVPKLCAIGPHLACDTVLIGKLIRLAKTFVAQRDALPGTEESKNDVFRSLLTVVDEVMLPCQCLLSNNCCMVEEIWSFLKMLNYQYRYRMYGQWKNDTYNNHAILIRQKADVIERAKYIMKRLAKENVKQLGRQIGKLSHTNPTILFEYVLSTIQKYDNFIGPVVDCLKYVTAMSLDILAYCVIEALANPEKERMKTDDTNLSLWLQSLANFAGSIFKKYSIELAGLVQYIVNQLKAGKSYDLMILRDVVTKMVGIEVSEEITDDQLDAMSGGEHLKAEGGYFAQVRNTKKSSQRLREALVEFDLAIPLCILMAHQRNAIVFQESIGGGEDRRHIKLVGRLYDQCQDTFVQFNTFLSQNMSLDEWSKKLPPIEQLLIDYHVAPEMAFSLYRSIFSSAVNSKYEEFRKADKKEKEKSTTQGKAQRYIDACNIVMTPLLEQVMPPMPAKLWEDLTPRFFMTFWTLTTSDLYVPTVSYERQVNQIKSQLNAVDDNRDMSQSKRKKERERCQNLIDKLTEEEKKQQEHVNRVMTRLRHEKDDWFKTKTTSKNLSVLSFLQYCVFPRCCLTANDAVFCARFIHALHHIQTLNFSSLICYDRIFSQDLQFSVSSCTENEAHRYGRFFCKILESLMRWHGDPTVYERECSNYPGFSTVFRKAAATPANKNANVADPLDFENYRHVVHKWHFNITKAMVACLESTNYVQIRNALIILTKILPYYPKVTRFGMALERRIEKLCQEEKDKRPDMYALAMGFSGLLKSRKSTWVVDSIFHPKTGEQVKLSASSAVKVNGVSPARREAKEESSRRESYDKGKDTKKSVKAKSEVSKNAPDKTDEGRNKDTKDKKVKKEKEEKVRESKKDAKPEVKDERRKEEERRAAKEEERRAKMKEEPKDEPRDRRDDSRDRREKLPKVKKEPKSPSRERRRDKEDDRSASVASNSSHGSSGHRRSAEPSPKRNEDRDTKRRKVEAPSLKESPRRSTSPWHEDPQAKHHRSPGQDRSEREKKSKDRSDRKRASLGDDELMDSKRHKGESSSSDRQSSKSAVNGDSHSKSRGRPRSPAPKEHRRGAAHRDEPEEEESKKSRRIKESPDVKDRKEKHSKKSSKK